MRILLDTHIILWLLTDDPRLSENARQLLRSPARNVHYSVASLWEVGIKRSLGRLLITPQDVGNAMRDSGYSRLQIEDVHIERIVTLPLTHRDPFDRMLIAQADTEPMKLVTSDRRLEVYGPSVLIV